MFFGLFVLAVVNAQSTNPGFSLALSNAGLEYARSVGVPILEKAISTASIPDFSASVETPVGHVTFTLSSINANNANLGRNNISTNANGLTLTIADGSIALTASWKYRENSFPHVKDHGTIDMSASGLAVDATITPGMTSTHEPSLAINGCNTNIGALDIKFHGGASWLYNLFKSDIADSIKSALKGQVCAILVTEMGPANAALAKLPTTEALDAYAGINFELLLAPDTTASFLRTSHVGSFYDVKAPTVTAPIAAAPLDVPAALPRMMYIWVTSFLGESAAWAYGKAGRLTWTIKPSDIPPQMNIKLNTAAFALVCPALQLKYPNMNMTMQLNTSAEFPLVPTIAPAGINVTGAFASTFYVDLPNGTQAEVFMLNTTAHLTATVSLNTTRKTAPKMSLHYNLELAKVDLDVVQSTIGTFNPVGLQIFFNFVVVQSIVKQLNVAGANGFPIPTLDGIALMNPEIVFQTGAIRIDTDIAYDPSYSNTPVQQAVAAKVARVD